MVIGYEKAKDLMEHKDWKLQVTMYDGQNLERVEVYHPKEFDRYILRCDAAKKLVPKCRVCGRLDHFTAILCYDHDASDEALI